MADLTTLARPYAKAVFQLAQAEQALGKWSTTLALLSAVTGQEKVSQALASPSLTVQQQADILFTVCGDALQETAKSLVSVLAENKRLNLLAEIATLFEALKAEAEKTVDVEITSAVSIDDALVNKLTAALKNKLNRDVKISRAIDEHLIGGAIIRAGDTVIDYSVRSRLAKLAEAMHS